MTYVVETKLPNYDDWYPVLDLDNSKLHPTTKKFETEEQAKAWAEKYSVAGHEWRIVEDEIQ